MQEKNTKNITEPVTELGISKLGGVSPSKVGALPPHPPSSNLTYPNVSLLT